eukprot:14466471-Alexandrium_andersonii.AAC.1
MPRVPTGRWHQRCSPRRERPRLARALAQCWGPVRVRPRRQASVGCSRRGSIRRRSRERRGGHE